MPDTLKVGDRWGINNILLMAKMKENYELYEEVCYGFLFYKRTGTVSHGSSPVS